MGTQQKLFILLALIISTISIVVGFKIFKSAETHSKQKALANNLLFIARKSQEYYRNIRFLGGGGRSFKGLNKANGVKKLFGKTKNENGTFQIMKSRNDQQLIIRAVGTFDGDGDGNADIVSNAQASSYSSYTVQTAALTVAKNATTLWDPVNAAVVPKAIPGAYVTYSISVANAAAAADAALTTLSDDLPAELVLDPDFVTSDGSTPTSGTPGDSIQVVKGATTIYCTAASDGDGCDYAGNTVTVDFTNATFAAIMPLAASETVTVNFNGIVQ